MTKIYLIRHGQSMGNFMGVFQGSTDVHLTDLGREQAEKLGERCRDLSIDAVYSSELSRAYDTACAVASRHGLSVTKVPGLEEVHLGIWEGRAIKELEVEYPDQMELWRKAPHLMRVEGGETMQEASDRFCRALDGVIAQNAGRTIAVVAHGGVIRYFLAKVKGLGLERLSEISVQQNTSINCLEYECGKFELIFENDNRHLG